MMFSKIFEKIGKQPMNVRIIQKLLCISETKKYAITGMRYEKGKLVGFQMNEKEVLEVK